MKVVYTKVKEGEWVQPSRRGHRVACCDCGLVHVIDLRLVKSGRGHAIQFRAFRDERETKARRKREHGGATR